MPLLPDTSAGMSYRLIRRTWEAQTDKSSNRQHRIPSA